MKLILIILIFSVNIFAQKAKHTTYLNGDNKIVTEGEFRKIKKIFEAKNDSLNLIKAVVHTRESGSLNSPNEIYDALSKKTTLDSQKPIVIIFHPGKDKCNSSGASAKEWIKPWYRELESKILKLSGVKPIYLYKTKSGLEKYNGIIEWQKDPNGIVEQTFFDFQYPCKSYVVISPSGNYISSFGEFTINQLIDDLTEILEK